MAYFSGSSIDSTPGYFNVLVSKRRGGINMKNGADVVLNRSQDKMLLCAMRRALSA